MTFRLPLLLYVMAVLAAFLATFGTGGLLGFAAWASIVIYYARKREAKVWSCLAELVMFVAITGTLIALLLPAVNLSSRASRRMQCSNNLKNISLALLNYEQHYGSLPPAYVADEQGKPLHSWRVLLLPFLEQQSLYDLYDFSEPWDGPNNRQLAKYMPPFYRCSSHTKNIPGRYDTNYVVVTGPNTAFPGAATRTLEEIRDGMSNTVMVVETADRVCWTEPRDLTFAEACQTSQKPAASSRHGLPRESFFYTSQGSSGFDCHVGFVDGSIRYLPGPLKPAEMAALLTIAGGEAVEPDQPRISQPRVEWRWNWRNINSLLLLIALILMPLVWRPWKMRDAKSEEP